jgi:hypothetical protein
MNRPPKKGSLTVTFSDTRLSRSFDDGWRAWIAENLVRGEPPEKLLSVLVSNGFDPAQASREIQLAQASPYLRGAERLANRIAKRDWVLDIRRKLARLIPGRNRVERRHKLSREEFLRDYYAAGRPVIITGMMDDWPALAKWTPDSLKARYGDRVVEIQADRNSNRQYEVEQPHHRKQVRFSEFIDTIQSSGETNDVYMTANNSGHNTEALADLWNDVVQIPEYLDGNDPRRGFFWFGPAGTVTPLHHDLTNNFMAQVYGRKLVRMVPAEEAAYVYNHLHCYSEVDLGNVDYGRFPLMRDATVLECELCPGEILFLPVGCWHYVRGLDISITMTFTNFLFDNDFHSNYRTYHEV